MAEFYHQKNCSGTSATPNFGEGCSCVPTATMPLILTVEADRIVQRCRAGHVPGIDGRCPPKRVIRELEAVGLRMQTEHPLHESKRCYPLFPDEFMKRTEHIRRIQPKGSELKPGSTPIGKRRPMVLVYQPALTHSMWMGCELRCRSVESLRARLRRGVRDGEWVAWRIITIEEEAMGNASSDAS